MYVQKVQLTPTRHTWIVIDGGGLPIMPIMAFLKYVTYTEKSPNTVRSYANHLKLFWTYLARYQKDWRSIKISDFALFINWLRYDQESVTRSTSQDSIRRQISSINTILAAITSFYRYHQQLGNTKIKLTELCNSSGNSYKSFLHHVYKKKPSTQRIIRLKDYKHHPKTLTNEQVRLLLDACSNARDRFLLLLLYETGLRIGQALLLTHVDIKSWDNVIHITPNVITNNDIRNKARKPNIIHVSDGLMRAYGMYLEGIHNNNLCEFVFINLKSYKPLSYFAVRKIFMRLYKKTNIKVSAHMFHHTHASNLIKHGWDASLVQRRLGHSSIQTTLDTYSHLDLNDLKVAYKNYLMIKGEK